MYSKHLPFIFLILGIIFAVSVFCGCEPSDNDVITTPIPTPNMPSDTITVEPLYSDEAIFGYADCD